MGIAEWIEALNSTDADEVKAAKDHLRAVGASAIDPLIAAMLSCENRQCWQAADVLADLQSDRAFAALSQALNMAHPLVSQTAARSLEKYGKRAVQPLIDSLPNATYMTQLRIVTALETLGDSRAVTPLIALLATVTVSSLRYTIIQALGKLGDPRAIDIIRPYLDDPDHHVRHRTEQAIALLTSL